MKRKLVLKLRDHRHNSPQRKSQQTVLSIPGRNRKQFHRRNALNPRRSRIPLSSVVVYNEYKYSIKNISSRSNSCYINKKSLKKSPSDIDLSSVVAYNEDKSPKSTLELEMSLLAQKAFKKMNKDGKTRIFVNNLDTLNVKSIKHNIPRCPVLNDLRHVGSSYSAWLYDRKDRNKGVSKIFNSVHGIRCNNTSYIHDSL